MARFQHCGLSIIAAALLGVCAAPLDRSRCAAADPPAQRGQTEAPKPPPGVLALSLEQKRDELRKRVQHVIVIYQENWSFDGLYGKFPGADGLDQAGAAVHQVEKDGTPYKALPR